MHKIIIMILLTILISLQYKLFFKDQGIKNVIKLNSEVKQQQIELSNLQLRNNMIKSEIKLIKDNPKAIEEYARVMFGMIKKDETYYRIIE